MTATTVRARGLAAGGRGLVNSRRAAAAARRGRAARLQLVVDLWRNAARFSSDQCCLPAGIGACSHDEVAHRDEGDAARLVGRAEHQPQRQWWQHWTTCNGHAVAGLDGSAAFGDDPRVRHVENLQLEMFNLVCDASVADSKRPSQSSRRTSCAAAAPVLLAEWRARAPTMAAAAAGAAGGGAGCTAAVVTCSSCPSVVSPTPHMHAQHAHARVHVHAQVHVHMHAFTIENKQATRMG